METNLMAISPIDKELFKCFSQLNDLQKTSLLALIKSFLIEKNELGSQTIDQYNLELDRAMERVGKGEFSTLEDLEREMKSW